MKLHAGDWVEIRSKEEILSTLDKKGQLEGLPFSPQMFQYCGQRFRVNKRAHKTCDTVNYYRGGGRSLSNSVHLELRCDGKAYGGCQAACLIFWKNAWLKPVDKMESLLEPSPSIKAKAVNQSVSKTACTEEDIQKGTHTQDLQNGKETRYICQATQLPYFTTTLHWWDIRQYLEDYTSGNTTLKQLFINFFYACFSTMNKKISSISYSAHQILIRFYDKFQALLGGLPYPRKVGSIPDSQSTPTCRLNLQPGELVRVKSYEEILATVNTSNKNRGMNFDAEMVPYCGGIFRVKARVERFINEKTGKMSIMKTPGIILEGVSCQSRYSRCRMGCPRSIYSWWREIWLERVPESLTIPKLDRE